MSGSIQTRKHDPIANTVTVKKFFALRPGDCEAEIIGGVIPSMSKSADEALENHDLATRTQLRREFHA